MASPAQMPGAHDPQPSEKNEGTVMYRKFGTTVDTLIPSVTGLGVFDGRLRLMVNFVPVIWSAFTRVVETV